jgi:hypothetical protein
VVSFTTEDTEVTEGPPGGPQGDCQCRYYWSLVEDAIGVVGVVVVVVGSVGSISVHFKF